MKFEKTSKIFEKKLLTQITSSDILNESLEGDRKKAAKSCERKWSLKIEQNNINI